MSLEKYTGQRTPAVLSVGQEVLNVIVEHLDFKRVQEGCLDLIHTMLSLKMPGGVLIQAEPGMGKTLLLQMIKRQLTVGEDVNERSRVLHIQLDSAVDSHKMAAAVMLALGYPMLPSRPNLENMNFMVSKGLAKQTPRALFIDEMQHVCEGNRDITARAVTDWLKVRMDAFNLPIICAGTRALDRLSSINPQFTSRASVSFVLTPFEFGDTWRQLLGAFKEAVTSVNLDLLNGPTARLVHVATKGNLRALKKLLMYACMHAAGRADAKVSLEDLARGFDDANGYAQGRSNPFCQSR